MPDKRQKGKKEVTPEQRQAMRRQMRLMLLLFLPFWLLSFVMLQRTQKQVQEQEAQKRAATGPIMPSKRAPLESQIRELEAIIAAQPRSPQAEQASITIAQLWEERGEWTLAAKQYDAFAKAYGRSPWAAHAKYTAGIIYGERLGDTGKMEKRLSKLTWDTKNHVWLSDKAGHQTRQLAALAARERLDPIYQHKWQYQMLDHLVGLFNPRENPGWAYALGVILLAVLVKLITFPFTSWSFRSMRQMQEKMQIIQPLLQDLKRRFKDDQMRMLREQQKLFKEQNIRMGSGCLPMVVQMAILIPMYGAINVYGYRFAQGAFLWVTNLGLPDWPLLIIYTISMIASMMLMPSAPSADPKQAKMMKWMNVVMPLMFLFMLKNIPSAFVLYWATFNVLSTTQQLWLYRRSRQPALAGVGSAAFAGANPSGPKPARIKRPKGSPARTDLGPSGDGSVISPATEAPDPMAGSSVPRAEDSAGSDA